MLFADDEVAPIFLAAQASAIPEETRGVEWSFAGDAAGEENEQAVAGPFGGAREGIGGAENDAAFGANFVKEESGVETHGVRGSAGGCGCVEGGDEEQVRIERVGANGVAAHDLKYEAVDVPQ